jgi:hypothetical protein
MISEETVQATLDTEFEHDFLGTVTVRLYLQALLAKLWDEGEGFSVKKPFGMSNWYTDLAEPLVRAGLLRNKHDTDYDDMVIMLIYAL